MNSARMRANETQQKLKPVRQPEREPAQHHEQGRMQAIISQTAYRRAQVNGNGLTAADLLVMQRTVGNRMAQRMLARRVDSANVQQQNALAEEKPGSTVQTKLTVGASDDVYEQDADHVAGQMMTMPEAATQRPNRTGLPDGLKFGIESLSGMSMNNVNVHYNSSQPARLDALAYTQGSDLHLAPGQEQHLPHEAWHVVQQAQDRVRPTMPMKDGVLVNDDQVLEHDADVMGEKALAKTALVRGAPRVPKSVQSSPTRSTDVIQRLMGYMMAGLFRTAHAKHPIIAGYAVNLGDDWTHAENIYNLGVQIAAQSFADLANRVTDAVNLNASLPSLTALLQAVQSHHPGTPVATTLQLVQDAGAYPDACPDLTLLVNTVAGNGTVAEIRTLVQRSVATLAATHTNDLLDLIRRNPAQNTPPRVTALLVGLNPNDRARYLALAPKIPLFTRVGAGPAHALTNYVVHGHNFMCNRFAFFYERHSYEYFDFGNIKNHNSMRHTPVADLQNELHVAMNNLTALEAVNLDAPGYQHVSVNNNNIGAQPGVPNKAITHMQPVGPAVDIDVRGPEATAIKHLR